MPSIGVDLEHVLGAYPAHVERRIKMRKQGPVAGSLPFERRAGARRIHLNQYEVASPGEMLGERGRHLVLSRKVDVTVAHVIGGTQKAAVPTRRLPRRPLSDLVKSMRCSSLLRCHRPHPHLT